MRPDSAIWLNESTRTHEPSWALRRSLLWVQPFLLLVGNQQRVVAEVGFLKAQVDLPRIRVYAFVHRK